MDDLISRQAAIDTVVAWTVEDRPDIEMPTDLIDRIKNMPSAQPEAKPPKWIAEDRYVKNRFAVFPYCPQCNADITVGQCYCMICGQHIDWSEDDE